MCFLSLVALKRSGQQSRRGFRLFSLSLSLSFLVRFASASVWFARMVCVMSANWSLSCSSICPPDSFTSSLTWRANTLVLVGLATGQDQLGCAVVQQPATVSAVAAALLPLFLPLRLLLCSCCCGSCRCCWHCRCAVAATAAAIVVVQLLLLLLQLLLPLLLLFLLLLLLLLPLLLLFLLLLLPLCCCCHC